MRTSNEPVPQNWLFMSTSNSWLTEATLSNFLSFTKLLIVKLVSSCPKRTWSNFKLTSPSKPAIQIISLAQCQAWCQVWWCPAWCHPCNPGWCLVFKLPNSTCSPHWTPNKTSPQTKGSSCPLCSLSRHSKQQSQKVRNEDYHYITFTV